LGVRGAPPLWLTLVLGHGRGLTQAARTETYPPLPIRPLSAPPPPGALLYTARCAALRATSGSEGSGCHQAQRTGGREPQRGVLPSRGLSTALTLTSFSDSYPRLDLWPEREHVFKDGLHGLGNSQNKRRATRRRSGVQRCQMMVRPRSAAPPALVGGQRRSRWSRSGPAVASLGRAAAAAQ